MEDTIAAIVTAPGPASVGIIRISGNEAAIIGDKVFLSKTGKKLKEKKTHTVTHGNIIDENLNIFDDALALNMWNPKSFTGEDVIELQCHGGMIVLQKVLELVLKAGARIAEPGEFSKRAFLNGKIDLSQAEAIMDLINAKTLESAKAAANNLKGVFSQKVKEIDNKLINVMAYLEADIDFPEEEFTRWTRSELRQQIEDIYDDINRLLVSFKSGRIIREGLKTVLIGKPNVGKSSILNSFLKEKRAIVTDIPGTTRDIIEEYYNLGGIPIILIDTAGIRETENIVEKIGVEKAKETMLEADLILYVIDAVEGITSSDTEIIKGIKKNKVLIVINKIDLMKSKLNEQVIKEQFPNYNILFVSAIELTGIGELEEAIKCMFFTENFNISDPMITNIRHKEALYNASVSIGHAIQGVEGDLPADFITIDIKNALYHIREITGETLDENVIDKIFSQFCLGK